MKLRSQSVRRRRSLSRCCCYHEGVTQWPGASGREGREHEPVELPLILYCTDEFPFCSHLRTVGGLVASKRRGGKPTVSGVLAFKTSGTAPGGGACYGNYPSCDSPECDLFPRSPPSPAPSPVLRSSRHPVHGTQECLRKVPIRSHPKWSKDNSREPTRRAQGRRVTCGLQLGWLPPRQAQRFIQGR